jgi:hypothetical protein
MKYLLKGICSWFIFSALTISSGSCKKTENPIRYPKGTFPDSTFVLTDLNSAADDYNDLNSVFESINTYSHELFGDITLVFTSNRSGGLKTDLMQGIMTFSFNQTDGTFGIGSEMTTDAFLTSLLSKANTSGNDLGPYRLFSSADGYEFLLLSSENAGGNLDFYFLKNLPAYGSNVPAVYGPFPASLLNTSSDEAYICFNTNKDTAYFSSNSGGNFDIYLERKPAESSLETWLNSAYSAPVKADSVNSTSNDNSPYVFKKIMVFASDRPGGMGGSDLYYSVFKNGKWNSPVNFGPGINTSSDETRPELCAHTTFTNYILIFSSNRPGGKGGYDIYSRGVSIEE